MGLDGPNGSVILTERNKAAVKVLSDTVKAGKKKISLFYGAAHMPDLSKRVREMGFKPVGAVEWKQAWDLRIRADQPSAVVATPSLRGASGASGWGTLRSSSGSGGSGGSGW